MSKRERNLLIFLAIVALVALPFLNLGSLFSRGGGSELSYSPEEIAAVNKNLSQLPELKTDLLHRDVIEFKGARRNLFTYSAAYDESRGNTWVENAETIPAEDYTEVEPDSDETDETGEPQTRQQKLAGYEFLGLHEINGEKTASFSWRGQTLLGKVGTVVNGAFEIKEITGRSVVIFVMNGQFEQTLNMKSPAGNTGGKDK